MIKVISGEAKGTKLKWDPKETRPLTQRAKAALFDIISPYLESSKILDLYAGSGALGIEALSRGAKEAIFVDISKHAIFKIKENLNRTHLIEKADVYQMSTEKYIDQFLQNESNFEKFNIIFVFAPYKETNNKIISKSAKLLFNEGILIVEHSKKFHIRKEIEHLKYLETRTYGITSLSFFQKDINSQETNELSNISEQ